MQKQMDNLKTVYKKIKDTTNETGKKRRSFLHFELLDSIVGERPSYSPVFTVSSIDSSSMSSIPDVEELQPSQALPIHPSKRSSSSAEEGHANSPEREQPASSSNTKLSKKDKKGVKRKGQVMSERAKLQKEFLEEMRSTQEKFLDIEKKRMEREELEDMKRREWEAEQDKRREEFFLKMLFVMAKNYTTYNCGKYSRS